MTVAKEYLEYPLRRYGMDQDFYEWSLLVNRPKVLLADEPTGALDSNTGLRIMELMHELHQSSGVTILMITHDQQLAQRCGVRVRMLDGRIADIERDITQGGQGAA